MLANARAGMIYTAWNRACCSAACSADEMGGGTLSRRWVMPDVTLMMRIVRDKPGVRRRAARSDGDGDGPRSRSP